MPCVLLTLASEEVRGETFLPWAASAWELLQGFVFQSQRHWKQTVYSSCHESVILNGKLAPTQRANCPNVSCPAYLYFIALVLAFTQSTPCTDRTVKGEIAGHSQPVTCGFCCYVICMRYTSFASQQEKFRARTLRATTAAPPHAVLRESLLCVNLAAEMGVCSDVNAISLSLSVVFHVLLMHIVTFWGVVGLSRANGS